MLNVQLALAPLFPCPIDFSTEIDFYHCLDAAREQGQTPCSLAASLPLLSFFVLVQALSITPETFPDNEPTTIPYLLIDLSKIGEFERGKNTQSS